MANSEKIPPPVSLLAEITHRCPLQCPYCSNPLALERAAVELDTATWLRVIEEAHALGVLQTHFSGGEPTWRDLPELVRHAGALGQYTNLITAAVLLDPAKLDALADAGLDHVQISIQDSEPGNADRIGGYSGGHAKKLAVARMSRRRPAAHHQRRGAPPEPRSLDRIIALAVELGARRLEVAHVQYYGWALANRAALMPTRAQAERSIAAGRGGARAAQGRADDRLLVPDYYARYPKPCMGGWARQNLNVTPSGKVLPCHAAEGIGAPPSTTSRTARSPTSGTRARRSTPFAAPTGWRSPAGAARAGAPTSAAAAARRSR